MRKEEKLFVKRENEAFLELVSDTDEKFNESLLVDNKLYSGSSLSISFKPVHNKIYVLSINNIIVGLHKPYKKNLNEIPICTIDNHYYDCNYSFILKDPFEVKIYDKESNSIIYIDMNISGKININIIGISDTTIGFIFSLEDKTDELYGKFNHRGERI